MCPYDYYTQMRDARQPEVLRLVGYACHHGVKPTAQAYPVFDRAFQRPPGLPFVCKASQRTAPGVSSQDFSIWPAQ